MVGIKWIADNVPTDEDDKFITGPIQEGEQRYSSIADNYQKAIKCNTQFNSDIPAGKYVSKFFKEINRNYVPVDVDDCCNNATTFLSRIYKYRNIYSTKGQKGMG
jgi:hypothetical protein